MKKVIVALSGGVDSSVAAALLQEQGWQVEGVFMKNWTPEDGQSLTDCPWQQDQDDAAAVCAHLGIPFRSVNFEKEYKERVVDYFLSEYAAGRTPNPDVMCNKEIKFAAFLEMAKKAGVDKIATGHYARLTESEGKLALQRGVDPGKDQSYFLYSLNKDQLGSVLFPVGALPKSEVRQLAARFGLPTASKKDSQGICFIGHLDLKNFLREQLGKLVGSVYLLPAYEAGVSLVERMSAAVVVGKDMDTSYYTIGERAGEVVDNGLYRRARLGAEVSPLYVLTRNGSDLYLTEAREDAHFRTETVVLENWQFTGAEAMPLENVADLLEPVIQEGLLAQVRYQQKELAKLTRVENTEAGLMITFAAPFLWAVAPGQSLVVYRQNGEVLGGGVIKQAIHTKFNALSK